MTADKMFEKLGYKKELEDLDESEKEVAFYYKDELVDEKTKRYETTNIKFIDQYCGRIEISSFTDENGGWPEFTYSILTAGEIQAIAKKADELCFFDETYSLCQDDIDEITTQINKAKGHLKNIEDILKEEVDND